jgi:GT2 family glycosyltransferase
MTGANLTVVVPTLRQRDLEAALESLAAQTSRDFETLVVENGEASAQTQAIVQAFRDRANARYLFSDQPGANAARNLGVASAASALIALTDDDCEVEADWVARILDVFNSTPSALVVGGAVALKFLDPPPAWLVEPFPEFLSKVEWRPPFAPGPSPDLMNFSADWRRYLVSANMAIRRPFLLEMGGFHEGMGYIGREEFIPNDELVVLDEARRRGPDTVFYVPRLRVSHRIHEERTTLAYFRRRFHGQGIADVVYERHKRQHKRMTPAYSAIDHDALYESLARPVFADGLIPYWIDQARTLLPRESDRRQYVRHLLDCKIEYLKAVQSQISAG